jgi:small subunit ribosomal protein S20
MPQHKSAAKRVITNEKRRRRNLALRTRMRTALKAVRSASSRAQAQSAYRQAVVVLDRTVAKGVIRKETANRHKSRLARLAARLPA